MHILADVVLIVLTCRAVLVMITGMVVAIGVFVIVCRMLVWKLVVARH